MNISVIIPVLNEENALRRTLLPLAQACRATGHEVIVVDGGSRDGSRQAAQDHADKVIQSRLPGRASQMHQGALAASGDLLLFLHADTQLPQGWEAALQRAWASRPAATAFRLGFDSDRPVYRLLARLASWRTRLTGIPHGDQAIAISREMYFSVGGFPPVPLMEEYALLRKLRRAGRIVILPDRVRTSARRYEKNGPWRNAASNSLFIGLYYLGVSPERLASFYGATAEKR